MSIDALPARGRAPALRDALRRLGSTRLMLAGFAFLAAGAFRTSADDGAAPWWTVGPLLLLAFNLAAALATHRRLTRGGLGVFHVALLALLLTAAGGRLARFEGRIELAEGQAFAPEAVEVTTRGPLHGDPLAAIRFVQGPYRVDYSPGLKRDRTHSEVAVARDGNGFEVVEVGDDHPLVFGATRFYTTHNKGFAPVLAWTPADGASVVGALHLPGYPSFDWKQENRFTPPGGRELRVFLELATPPDEAAAWTLDPGAATARLVVYAGTARHVLAPGGRVALDGGTLEFQRLAGWMGYRIWHDPTLEALLLLATLAVGGLGAHLLRAPPRTAPHGAARAVGADAAAGLGAPR